MNTDQRLHWVHANRSRKRSWQQVGTILQKLAQAVSTEAAALCADLAPVIAACLDDEVRPHCRVAWVNRRLVTVHVDSPMLVSMMRRRWLRPLRQAISESFRRRDVVDVEFRFGTTGVPLVPGAKEAPLAAGGKAFGRSSR